MCASMYGSIYGSKQVNMHGVLINWSTWTAYIIDVSYTCEIHTYYGRTSMNAYTYCASIRVNVFNMFTYIYVAYRTNIWFNCIISLCKQHVIVLVYLQTSVDVRKYIHTCISIYNVCTWRGMLSYVLTNSNVSTHIVTYHKVS